MRKLKHLSQRDQLPMADIEAFAKAYEPGDIFEDTAGPGAHLAEGTRKMTRQHRAGLASWQSTSERSPKPPADRITTDRGRAFIEHLRVEIRATSVANQSITFVCCTPIAPGPDGNGSGRSTRLAARPSLRIARRLVPPWQTATRYGANGQGATLPSARKQRSCNSEMGASVLLSLGIRRRSIAVLTVSRT